MSVICNEHVLFCSVSLTNWSIPLKLGSFLFPHCVLCAPWPTTSWLLLLFHWNHPDMMVPTYNSKTGEVETGGLPTPGKLKLCIKFKSSPSYKMVQWFFKKSHWNRLSISRALIVCLALGLDHSFFLLSSQDTVWPRLSCHHFLLSFICPSRDATLPTAQSLSFLLILNPLSKWWAYSHGLTCCLNVEDWKPTDLPSWHAGKYMLTEHDRWR